MDSQKINNMYSTGSRFSYIRLALNYYTLADDRSVLEDQNAYTLIMELNGIIERTILGDKNVHPIEVEIDKLEVLRNQVTSVMESLTTYVDHFEIYEYVLNRVEYRLKESEIELEEPDEIFTRKLMRFITSTKDNTVLNGRIQSIVGQLPVRMTKAKFYSFLADGLSIYKRVNKKSIEDILYMLRTSAMMTSPTKENFEVPWDILEIFKKIDYKTIQKDEFIKISEQYAGVSEWINDFSGMYLLIQEIINDLYVILLAKPFALTILKEQEACVKLISSACQTYHEGPTLALYSEHDMDVLEFMEGKQEVLYEKLLSLDFNPDHIKAEDVEIHSERIAKIDKLISGSSFVSLKEETKSEGIADETFMMEALSQLIKDFDQLFSCHSKMVVRSIMAKTLSALPTFFNTAFEIEKYIKGSLENCNEIYEKATCMDILEEFMADAYDME